MSLTKRSGKGSALTYNEMDDNLTHLGGDGSYQFPSTDGSSDQVLATNGSGQLSFVDQSGGGGDITFDADSQYVQVMDGFSVNGKKTDWKILKGGIVDVVCIGSAASGGSSNNPNFIIYGTGIVDI